MRKLTCFILLSLLVFPLILGCITQTRYSDGDGGPSTDKIQILSHSGAYEGNQYYRSYKVTGTAKNVSSKQLSYAEIRVRFYDAAGCLLDTSLDNINDLGVGQTWAFEVVDFGSHDNIDHYDIGVGTTL